MLPAPMMTAEQVRLGRNTESMQTSNCLLGPSLSTWDSIHFNLSTLSSALNQAMLGQAEICVRKGKNNPEAERGVQKKECHIQKKTRVLTCTRFIRQRFPNLYERSIVFRRQNNHNATMSANQPSPTNPSEKKQCTRKYRAFTRDAARKDSAGDPSVDTRGYLSV